jgi:hypothetical protein
VEYARWRMHRIDHGGLTGWPWMLGHVWAGRTAGNYGFQISDSTAEAADLGAVKRRREERRPAKPEPMERVSGEDEPQTRRETQVSVAGAVLAFAASLHSVLYVSVVESAVLREK